MAKFIKRKDNSRPSKKDALGGKSPDSFKAFRSKSGRDTKAADSRYKAPSNTKPGNDLPKEGNGPASTPRPYASRGKKSTDESTGSPARSFRPKEYNSKSPKGKAYETNRKERGEFKATSTRSGSAISNKPATSAKGKPDRDRSEKFEKPRSQSKRGYKKASGERTPKPVTDKISSRKEGNSEDRPGFKNRRVQDASKPRRSYSEENSDKTKGNQKEAISRDGDKRRLKKPYPEKRTLKTSRLEEKNQNTERTNTPAPDSIIRLNRYIANAGICSRREADTLIQDGLIKVNGKVVTELGHKVQRSDTVKFGNKLLSIEKQVYVLLNKPKDFITTMDDPQERKTVMDLVKNACLERVFPVGRLDRNTTGLLLLTNDGELTKKLTHPSYEVSKIYQVGLDKPFQAVDLEKISEGITLEDGTVKVDDIAMVSEDQRFVGIEIHEGRNRIVRRLFESLGYVVETLDRVMYAGLTKKDLPRGKWRLLTTKEVLKLKQL